MAVCQVCQKDNPQGVEYCEDCGAALTPTREPATVGATPTTPSGTSGAAPQTTAPSAPEPQVPTSEAGSQAPPAAGQQETSGPAAGPTSGTPGTEAAAAGAPQAGPAAPTPAAGSAEQRPRLLVKRFGALTDEEIPLQGERLLVGRFDPETGPVDLDLSSLPGAEHISRQHAELYRETEGRWFVRDLGSTNGVFVRSSADASFGPRITEPRGLANGDEVAFGNSRFVFRTN